jgi:putative ABC transport system permease protein
VWRATLKSLLAKKLRLVLTALSIVLGVGFMAGTYVLTDTMAKAFEEVFQTAAAETDVLVRAESAFSSTAQGPGGGGGSEGRQPIQASLLEDVLAVDGVATAHGDVQGYAQFVDPATNEAIGGFGPPTIGLSWDPGTSVLQIREGRAPQGPGEVAVDAGTARAHGLAVGDEVQVLFTGPPQTFRIVAVVGFGDADNLAGATLALFELETAQVLFDKVGVYDGISVDAEEGVGPSELRSRIQAVLPEGVEAVTAATVADESAQALKDGLGFFTVALLVFAFIALFVGAFIIFNTFSIITAQRTRELALLRALGASRRQVLTSVLAEAALVGLVASAVGIGVGVLVALGLEGLLSLFGIDLPSTDIQLLPRTIVVSLAVGTVVTLVASVVPARRAARVAPIEALRDGAGAVRGASLHRRIIVGVAVTALGVIPLLYGLFAKPESVGQLVGFGAAVTFLGIALLSPLVARPVASVLGAPLRRLGVHGRLGQENAMRNPRRTASTAAALMIGLALVSMVTILSSSLKASFDAALEETLKADLTITTTSFTAFSPEVASLVRTVPEAAAVSEFRQNVFRYDGNNSFLTAVDPATIESVATLEMIEGTTAALSQGSILVHADVAEANGFAQGDTVTLAFPSTGQREFVVGGIYGENRLVGDWVVSVQTYEQNYTEQLDSFVLVKGAPGVSPDDLRAAVEARVGDFPNIEVQDQAAFREKQAGLVDQLLGLVTAMLLLAVLIALFGIVNTLSLSIFERTREIGLLRAVGMTRRQIRAMVRWESVIIAVFGALLGLAIGVFFGFSLQRALQEEGLSELAIPGRQLAVYVVLAGLAGVVAAVAPARKAAQLNVLEAITYE